MGFAYVPNGRNIPAVAVAALLLSSLSLGECATAIAGTSLMDAKAQATPKTSIYDPPPKREKPAMTPDERLKMQKDLNAALDIDWHSDVWAIAASENMQSRNSTTTLIFLTLFAHD
jgi:hypothetical protein